MRNGQRCNVYGIELCILVVYFGHEGVVNGAKRSIIHYMHLVAFAALQTF